MKLSVKQLRSVIKQTISESTESIDNGDAELDALVDQLVDKFLIVVSRRVDPQRSEEVNDAAMQLKDKIEATIFDLFNELGA